MAMHHTRLTLQINRHRKEDQPVTILDTFKRTVPLSEQDCALRLERVGAGKKYLFAERRHDEDIGQIRTASFNER